MLQVYQQVSCYRCTSRCCVSCVPASFLLQVYQQVLCYKCTSKCHVTDVPSCVVLQVYQQVLNEQCQSLMESLVSSIAADRSAMENMSSSGDVNKLMYRVNGVRWHCPTSTQWHFDNEDTFMCIKLTHQWYTCITITRLPRHRTYNCEVDIEHNSGVLTHAMLAYKPTNSSC